MYCQLLVPTCGYCASVNPEIWTESVSQSEAINDTSARVLVTIVDASATDKHATNAAVAKMTLRPFTFVACNDSKRTSCISSSPVRHLMLVYQRLPATSIPIRNANDSPGETGA